MMNTLRSFALTASLAVCCLLSPSHLYGQGPWIDSPMYRDPDLPRAKVTRVFPEKAKGLWRKALKSPQVDQRCKAAEAFSLATRRGVTGLADAIPDLVEAL